MQREKERERERRAFCNSDASRRRKNVSFYYRVAGRRTDRGERGEGEDSYAKYTRRPAACETNVHFMHPECLRTDAKLSSGPPRYTRARTRVQREERIVHRCSWDEIVLRPIDSATTTVSRSFQLPPPGVCRLTRLPLGANRARGGF